MSPDGIATGVDHVGSRVGHVVGVVTPEHVRAARGVRPEEGAERPGEAPLGDRGRPVDEARLEVVEEEGLRRLPEGAEVRSRRLDRRAVPRVVHLDRVEGLAHLGAVAGRDPGGADQVRAGLLEGVVVVEEVRARDEVAGERAVLDLAGLRQADPGDRVAVEAPAVGHQREGVVRDAAVRVDTAAVAAGGRADEVRRPPSARVAELVGVHHVPDGAQAGHVLPHQPADTRGVGAPRVRQVHRLAEDVGERLVQRARLHVVEEVGARLRDGVGELVGVHVVGGREAVPEDHLAAVPESILVGAAGGVRAVVHGGDERRPAAVPAVAAVLRPEVVVGVAQVGVGVVGVGVAGRGPALGAHQAAGKGARAEGVVDGPVLPVGELAEVEDDAARARVHPRVLAQRLSRHLDEPGEVGGRHAPVEEAAVQDLEPRRAELRPVERHVLGEAEAGALDRGLGGDAGPQVELARQGERLAVRGHDARAPQVDPELAGRDGDPPVHLAEPHVVHAGLVARRCRHDEELRGALEAEGLPVGVEEGHRALCRRDGRRVQHRDRAPGRRGDERGEPAERRARHRDGPSRGKAHGLDGRVHGGSGALCRGGCGEHQCQDRQARHGPGSITKAHGSPPSDVERRVRHVLGRDAPAAPDLA